MVHLNIPKPLGVGTNEVHDPDCQHAFILVGYHTVFAIHMTQYHCEKHKYQLIVELDLPEDELKEYRRQKELYPKDTFVLSNYVSGVGKDDDKFSIPKMAGLNLGEGREDRFDCVIHQGFRTQADPNEEDWFPWNLKDTIPVIEKFNVRIKRIVHFRPFAHNEESPEFANYILWGAKCPDGEDTRTEAHLHNVQYASLLTSAHEPWLFGLDHDHVMSLREGPDWLCDDMLHAGTVLTMPAIRRRRERADGKGDETFLLPKPPFEPGDRIALMYRGQQPPRHVEAAHTFLWGSMVNNSPELVPVTKNMELLISAMPKRYWR